MRSVVLRLFPILLATGVGAALHGCKPACQEGFTEDENGSCLRNHYGDPHENTGDTDIQDSGLEGPACNLVEVTHGTDTASGDEYLKISLGCTDLSGDLNGGNVHVVVDDASTSDHPIVASTADGYDPGIATLNGPTIVVYVKDVANVNHTVLLTISDVEQFDTQVTVEYNQAP